MGDKLLEVRDLEVWINDCPILNGLSFTLNKGEIVGLAGNSGSGKSVLSRSILGLEYSAQIGEQALIKFYSNQFGEIDLNHWSNPKMDKIRGIEISMIFQEPKMALNPVYTCGFQIKEVLENHLMIKAPDSVDKTRAVLNEVGLPDRIFDAYPFQISGGEAQRVMIAMSTVLKPQLLIADEPTTSLDPSNERSIIENLQWLSNETGMTILLISHDEKLLENVAERVLYLDSGLLLDRNPKETNSFFNRVEEKVTDPVSVLNVTALSLDNIGDQKVIRPILKDLNFNLLEGEILGIVGNSGSGKTTLARCILHLLKQYEGVIEYKGVNLKELNSKSLNKVRQEIQIIFQDPFDALNPRMKIGDLLLEVLNAHKIGENRLSRKELINEMLDKVQLSAEKLDQYSHQLSGGERQRACIARVLLLNPSLLVLDEPVTSLDSSLRFDILALLLTLKKEFNLTYIFISHDLSLINFMCDRVLVMKEGSIVEEGSVSSVFDNPTHDYTKALLQKISK